MNTYESFRRAEDLFAHRDYRGAARVLEELVAEAAYQPVGHALTDARTLLARAYFHSAQLRRAEEASRALLAEDPTHAYAALLLAFTLRRAGRRDEAERAMTMANALGAQGAQA
ncbi:hypothetical protein [Nocardioides sp. LHG3406-4]|uniref:hypothetical protein n=1 Tax=Nocardioides sp. LHG3406-4 TaxID=2804575 RepID=UPI003CF52415